MSQVYRSNMGDLVAGAFPIPQNPIMDAVNANAARVVAINSARKKGVGDLTPGSYPVPFNPFFSQQMNPVISGQSSMLGPRAMMSDTSNALASSVASMTTGPTATLTGFDLSSVTNSLTSSLPSGIGDVLASDPLGIGVPVWVIAAGALAVYMFKAQPRPESSRYHRARRAASAARSAYAS